MAELSRIFQTRDQAMEIYKTQLAHQVLFVEVFEALRAGTEVTLTLAIRETAQKITLSATVDKMVRKADAIAAGYGQRPGVMLNVHFTPDIIEPFRAFFLAGANKGASAGSAAAPQRPVSAGVSASASAQRAASATPGVSAAPRIRALNSAGETVESKPKGTPFAKLSERTEEDIKAELTQNEQEAEKGNLFALFGLTPTCDRKDIRRVYNELVRSLHPDTYPETLSQETRQRLEAAYQTYNDAYQIIQHNEKRDIYMDVSRKEGRLSGMSLAKYVEWTTDYKQRNSAGIEMCGQLVEQARECKAAGELEQARQKLTLALQYDPFNIDARSLKIED